MSEVKKNYVRYFLSGSFYTVGNNETSSADGITDASYTGEITIEDKINGKEVLEISQRAFESCKIKKVTIYAKIRKINLWAFCYCSKLEYINIPSSVTYIGQSALFLGESGVVCNIDMFIEFNKGRAQELFIYKQNFANRKTFFIIYPSTIAPEYSDTLNAFWGTETYYICAPSVFTFYTKQTTKDFSKCPDPIFKERKVRTFNDVCASLVLEFFIYWLFDVSFLSFLNETS